MDALELGRRAAQLLRDPTFQAAMQRAEDAILTEWSSTEPRDGARREELHAELRALRRVKGRIQAMETDAKQIDDRRSSRA